MGQRTRRGVAAGIALGVAALAGIGSVERPVAATSGYDWTAVDDEIESRVGGLFQPAGASLRIMVDGVEVHLASYGSGPAADPDEPIPLFSVSKWVSATVVMSLVEDGTLDLDDKVVDVLNGITFVDPRWADVTVEHLLSHRSGLPPLLGPTSVCTGVYFVSLTTCVQTIALVPLTFAPGTAFQYGAPGYQVLGLVAEVASGENWYDLVDDHLTTPCGWTTMEFDGEQNPWIAGGVEADLIDLSEFTEAQRTGSCGTHQLLDNSSLVAMRASATTGVTKVFSPYNDGRNYGLGLFRTDGTAAPNPDMFSHAGAGGTHPWLDVEREYSAVLYLNGLEATGFTTGKQIFDAMLPLIEAELDHP